MNCENCGKEGAVFVGSSKSYGPDASDAENTPDNLMLGKAWLCQACIELAMDMDMMAAFAAEEEKARAVLPVTHKIMSVADDVCAVCHQCWEQECRAYETAHSQEERAYRLVSGAECLLRLAQKMRKG